MLGAANEIETTPAAPEATTDCPAEQDSECESEPECVAPQETFASFMKALGHFPLKDLPSASRISFRNNVKNKYNVYAEGDVYNKPCNKNCNRKCSNKKC